MKCTSDTEGIGGTGKLKSPEKPEEHFLQRGQGDRFVGEEGTLVADFMGRPARFPRGPFLVASRMRVPVVFYYSMREPGRRYRFHFVEAQATTRTALLDEYLKATENIVRTYPDQWFNFYKFWQ